MSAYVIYLEGSKLKTQVIPAKQVKDYEKIYETLEPLACVEAETEQHAFGHYVLSLLGKEANDEPEEAEELTEEVEEEKEEE